MRDKTPDVPTLLDLDSGISKSIQQIIDDTSAKGMDWDKLLQTPDQPHNCKQETIKSEYDQFVISEQQLMSPSSQDVVSTMSLETLITPAERVFSGSESQGSSETYIELAASEYRNPQTQYSVYTSAASERCGDLPATMNFPQQYPQPYTSQVYRPAGYMVPQSHQAQQPYQLNQSFYVLPANGVQHNNQNGNNIILEPQLDERKSPSTDEEGEVSKRSKRKRTAYTTQQLFQLEQEFREHKYINRRRRAELSMALGIPDLKIKVWFQNRRMKDKKECVQNRDHNGMANLCLPHQMNQCPSVNINEYYNLMGNQNIMAQLSNMQYQRVYSAAMNGQQQPSNQVANIAANDMQ